MKIQKKFRKERLLRGQKMANGQPGSPMAVSQKAIMPTVKRMQPGPAGGIMAGPGKKCGALTEMGKWWINGTSMTKMGI